MARESNGALWAEWRDRVATELVAVPNWQGTTPKFLRVRLPTRQVRDREVGGRVEIELPNGAVVRQTGDAERLLRDAIATAGARCRRRRRHAELASARRGKRDSRPSPASETQFEQACTTSEVLHATRLALTQERDELKLTIERLLHRLYGRRSGGGVLHRAACRLAQTDRRARRRVRGSGGEAAAMKESEARAGVRSWGGMKYCRLAFQ